MDSLTNEKILKFFSSGKSFTFKRREVIIRADDTPGGVYLIESGFVRMDAIFPDGSQITFNIFKPDAVFPAFWAVGGLENTYDYTALAKAVVWRRSKEEFLDFLKANPDVLFDLSRRIIVGVDGILSLYKDFHLRKAESRVATVILMLGKRFGKIVGKGKILLEIRLTHQDIAALAMLTRETVSLAYKKIADGKIICSKRGFITINNAAKLEKLCREKNADF